VNTEFRTPDAEEWVEISKVEFAEMRPRAGIDVLLRDIDAACKAEGRNPVCDHISKIGDSTWDGWKFVCRRKDHPSSPESQTEIELPTNQQLFEMVANLRDQMDKLSKRVDSVESSGRKHQIIGVMP